MVLRRLDQARAMAGVLLLAVLAGSAGCETDVAPSQDTEQVDPAPLPAPDPPAPAVLRRLTRSQYVNAIHDLFGESVAVPSGLEPDGAAHGLIAAGAAVNSVSPLGTERYANAAAAITEQLLEEPELRETLLAPCSKETQGDGDCPRAMAEHWGPLVWRRPMEADEVERLTELGETSAGEMGTLDAGVTSVLTALLQSPFFLYRVEVGELPGDGSPSRHTSIEMASRLSFFLWDGPPDAELLAAGESGALLGDEALSDQVARLLSDPRSRRAVRSLFADWLELHPLDGLTKDPTVFKHYSPDLGASAREETLLVAEHLVFEEKADIRTLLTTRTTFTDRRLAAIYNVPAVVVEGFGLTQLPADGPRSGFLGHVSFLAQHAHPVSSSPSLRGVFVLERLLCRPVPSPPADTNTAIPEPSETAVTLKERLLHHMEDPSCAGCHALIDPVGFGLEHFDGVGRYRILDNGGEIDPAGEIAGEVFQDATELAEVIAYDPDYTACVVRTFYTYATGHPPAASEKDLLAALTDGFAAEGHQVLSLMREIATSPGFRLVGEVAP